MKRIIAVLAVTFASSVTPTQLAVAAQDQVEPRILLPLDAGWRFVRADVAGAVEPGFDDGDWAEVTLPHTYNGGDGEDGGDYYRGAGWYRRLLELNGPIAPARVFFQFDGAALVADVYVNGRHAGRHEGGYARFRVDVSQLLKPGRNVVAVRVDNSRQPHVAPLAGDFTVFGGLFRRVFLLMTGDVHVDALDYGGPGVYVSTEKLNQASGAEVLVRTRVRNDRKRDAHVRVTTSIVDADGSLVREVHSDARIVPGAVGVLDERVLIRHPRLWRGVRDPYLYRAVTEIVDRRAPGEGLLDRVDTSFGIRTVGIDPDRGFLLNGEPVAVHGVNLFHSGRPGRGLAVTDAEMREDMAILDDLGVTGVRFVHFQHPPLAYDEADRLGFIVWTEIPLNGEIDAGEAFERNVGQQMRELIRQNFNHPSVAVWGLGNEVYASGPDVMRVLERVQSIAKEEDPSRPTAYAHCCQDDDDPKALVSDVSAFNRYFGWYPDQEGTIGAWAREFHHRFPRRSFAIGEYGAGASIRHQQDPPTWPEPAGGWHPEQYQAEFHEMSWRELAPLDYVWGKFVWVAFDLPSAGRSEGDRPGMNDKGLITYDRAVRKDAFYWYRASWSDEPTLHLTSKRAVLRTTREVDIEAYSNLDSVMLRVNGREIGIARVTDRVARWDSVELKPGVNHVEVEANARGEILKDAALWEHVQISPVVTGITH